MLKSIIIVAALTASISQGAIAQNAKEQTTAEKDALTVEQALNVSGGLSQLLKYETTDKDGKPSAAPYRFPNDTLYLMATNIDLGRKLETRLRGMVNNIRLELSEGTGNIPKEKEQLFNIKVNELSQTQSRVGYYHIKRADLCIDVDLPEPCLKVTKVPNQIPQTILSLIIPIIDR